jgi:ubiquinone/menaquinone biosynthesis C-methylase UbiE
MAAKSSPAEGSPMTAEGSDDQTREYYDDFASRYEDARRPHRPNGYHALVDDLEVELVERYGTGRAVLECGCGTGLLLERIARFAARAEGVDLSPGMLSKARARGLSVREASITALPFDDGTFDVACSFKVLAHVPAVGVALSEMARVVRPGGWVLAEFYNPRSLRGLVKSLGPSRAISRTRTEDAVYTRFDTPEAIRAYLPPNLEWAGARGIRVVTPVAQAMEVPLLRTMFARAERALCDTGFARFAGFYVAILRKSPAA